MFIKPWLENDKFDKNSHVCETCPKNHPKCLPEEIPKLVVDENPLLPSPVSIEFTKTPTKQSQSENPNAESPVLQETQLPVKGQTSGNFLFLAKKNLYWET